MPIKVEEKTVRKITIREPGRWWAIFTLDEDFGDISIQSDYGNWAYTWSKSGRGKGTLSEFLKDTGIDYLMNKFCMDKPDARRYFFGEETKRAMKAQVIKARRHRSDHTYEQVNKEEARSAWNTIEEADTTTAHQFVHMLDGCEGIKKIWGEEYWYDPPVITGYEPALTTFFKEVWPIFIRYLNGEQVSGTEAATG